MADSTLAGPLRQVEVVDAPHARVRRPGDLVGLVLSVAALIAVLLLAVFAHGTTEGVTEDVQSAFARLLRQFIQIPLNLLQAVVILLVPWIVLVERLVHKGFRLVLEALAAAVAAAFLAGLAVLALTELAPTAITRGLSIFADGERLVVIPPYVTALAAFLTVAGSRGQRRSVAWSWNLYWAALTIGVVTAEVTLLGALVTVLLGRAVGLATRYVAGVHGERAYGVALVEGMRRAGLDPLRIVRVGEIRSGTVPRTDIVSTAAPIGHTEHVLDMVVAGPSEPVVRPPVGAGTAETLEHASVREADEPAEGTTMAIARAADPAARVLERAGGRVYAVTDADGRRWDVVVLDGDRQVVGTLASAWTSLRLRGVERRSVVSLHRAAERASLMAYAARAAGVRTPELVGMAEVEDSVVIAYDHLADARRLVDLPGMELTEELLTDLWSQLRLAHSAGLAHRDLTEDSVLVRDGQIWIVGWAAGEVNSPEITRRLDIAQLLAVLATRLGVPRAVESAADILEGARLGAIAPLLQPVALPQESGAVARQRRAVLRDLRAALIDKIPPAADVAPVQLTRFSVRTVVTTTVAVVAGWLLLTTLNFDQITEAVQRANPAWAVGAFVLGLATFLGAAMSLQAFSPVRLTLWRTTTVQVAASVVALVAPAGVGPAALNLRYLNRQKVRTPLAVASVALMQVSQFVTTVVLLLLIAALTGTGSALQVPDAAIFVVMGILLAMIGLSLAVPQVRQWAWAKAGPTLRQVWPRLLWIIGQPARLGRGILGNVIMTGGYIAAFAATLAAFGQEVPLTQLSIIYLGGMALGSAVPTPGGLGTVELALSGGLAAAGVPPAVAASVAVLFRVLTFWGRVPLGWLALRELQKRNEL